MPVLYRTITRQSLHYFARPHIGVPDRPVQSAAVWRGKDLREAPDRWCYQFTDEDIAELEVALEHAQASGLATQKLSDKLFPLPKLVAKLERWRDQVNSGLGFVMLRGLPVERWSQQQCEQVFWCLGWHLGLPGAQNRQGDLLGHVIDTGQDPQDWRVREYATSVGISFHCDAADAVGLMCLRPAKQGGLSRIASSVAIINELIRREPLLAQRLFRPFELDARGESGLQHFPIRPACFDGQALRTFYHSGYFRSAGRYRGVAGLDEQQLTVLDAFDELANDPDIHLEMALQPGDIQLCSNHSIVHSRTAYLDFDEPDQRRHLLRLWLSFQQRESSLNRLRRACSMSTLVASMLRERWRQRAAVKDVA